METIEARGRVRVQPAPKRVRIMLGGVVVADTTDAVYVWENPSYPQYYVPLADVAPGALKETGTTSRSPSRGTARHFSVQGGDRVVDDAAWCYADSPIETLRDRVRFEWSAMDAWFEEDEEVFVHPRDPYTRIDVLRTSRRVRVHVRGTLLADSTRARMLIESGLPVRWYLPPEDVRTDLLEPSGTTTRCPYKGVASYWSVRLDGHLDRDIAWAYPQPGHDAEAVRGLLCFFDDRVDLAVEEAPAVGDPPRR